MKANDMLATDRLVRLYTATDRVQAGLIKNLLEQNGIECSIQGDHQADFARVFQINIVTWEKDFDRATEILDRQKANS